MKENYQEFESIGNRYKKKDSSYEPSFFTLGNSIESNHVTTTQTPAKEPTAENRDIISNLFSNKK